MTAITTRYQGIGDVAPSEAAKAERELRRMRRSLATWLEYRLRNDAVVSGEVDSKLPKRAAAERLWGGRDWEAEEKLATHLHALLSETMDATALPDPDLDKDPDAAVKLARIAIRGKVPSEAKSRGAVGLFWIWPAVVIVGGVMFTIMTAIRSKADVLKEKERLACIEAGACTDYGFWLKIGGISLAAWIAWDKFGLRDAVRRRRK